MGAVSASVIAALAASASRLSSTLAKKTAASWSPLAANCTAMERILSCSDGIQLAAKHWPAATTSSSSSSSIEFSQPPNSQQRILCLHGWLDNSSSFYLLAPALHSRLNRCSNPGSRTPTEIVALDFPGHGRSSHKSPDGPTQNFSEYVFYVSEALAALDWTDMDKSLAGSSKYEPITIIGHSMGAGIALLYAASFPEHVDRVILLEGAGPVSRSSQDVSKHVRDAVLKRSRSNRSLFQFNGIDSNAVTTTKQRVYPNLDAAVDARMKTARLAPGHQYLTRDAATELVLRAAEPIESAHTASLSTDNTNTPVAFRHDPRLQWPSLHYYTADQVDAIYKDVQCPVALLLAEDGWPESTWNKESVLNILKPDVLVKLKGSHHFHADPDTFEDVFQEIVKVLDPSNVNQVDSENGLTTNDNDSTMV